MIFVLFETGIKNSIPKSRSWNDAVEDVLWTRAKLLIKQRIALKIRFPRPKHENTTTSALLRLSSWIVLRPLAGVDHAAFEGGGAADKGFVFFGDELVVGDGVEFVVDFPEVFVRGDPLVAHGAEVEGARVRGEGF
jgi:hypothetical protein